MPQAHVHYLNGTLFAVALATLAVIGNILSGDSKEGFFDKLGVGLRVIFVGISGASIGLACMAVPIIWGACSSVLSLLSLPSTATVDEPLNPKPTPALHDDPLEDLAKNPVGDDTDTEASSSDSDECDSLPMALPIAQS